MSGHRVLAVAALWIGINATVGGISPASAGSPVDAGDFLPPDHPWTSSSQWVVGVAFDRAEDNFVGDAYIADQLIGLYVTHRWGDFGVNAKWLISPEINDFENVRGLASASVEAYFDAMGAEWVYRGGIDIEARLEDHFWTAHVAPVEIGIPLYTRGSACMHVFVGVRRVFAGALINSYVIDPNGFNNENARDAFDTERSTPWDGTISFVFARRID